MFRLTAVLSAEGAEEVRVMVGLPTYEWDVIRVNYLEALKAGAVDLQVELDVSIGFGDPRWEKINIFPSVAAIGGYPLYYVYKQGDRLMCAKCASKELTDAGGELDYDDFAVDINYEGTGLYCDCCDKVIPAAYEADEQ